MSGLNVQWHNSVSRVTGGAINTSDPVGSLVDTSIQVASASQFNLAVTSDEVGGATNFTFRKIWVTNQSVDDIENPRLYFSMLSYPSQVAVAQEKVADDTTADAVSYPSGYADGDFYSPKTELASIPLNSDTSSLDSGNSSAMWMRFKALPGLVSDPAAGFRLVLVGVPA